MRAGLFPGQGIEVSQVLSALEGNHSRVERAGAILGYDLVRRVGQVSRRSHPVLPTDLAQPAIFVAGLVAFDRALEEGASFDYLLGHSLGEYTALVAAGSIPFTHGVRLVAARGTAMQRVSRSSPGGMMAVQGLGLEQVADIAGETGVAVANDNSPEQVVLSGSKADLARAAQDVRERGGRSILLPLDAAFHTDAVRPAAAALADALDHAEVRSPTVPVLSNVTAAPYRAPGEIRRLLVLQLTHRVRFRECIAYLRDAGVSEFVDLGPGRIVGRFAGATTRGLTHA
jgi:[acyl-carrier-protein] S-malonyltransferase